MSFIIATASSVDPEGVGAAIGSFLIWMILILFVKYAHRPKRIPYPRNRTHHSITPFTWRKLR